MNNISEITRQDILDIIKDGFIVHLDEPTYDNNAGNYITEYPVKIPYYGRIDEISFLSRIYDLEKMPSKDSRYRNALGDISCHLRFGDYDDDCWFFSDDRFNLRHGDGDEPLLKFLCEMLQPRGTEMKNQIGNGILISSMNYSELMGTNYIQRNIFLGEMYIGQEII